MAGVGDLFVEGTWWYNQGRSSYQTLKHDGKNLYKQVLRQAKDPNGRSMADIYGELRPVIAKEKRALGWHWEAQLSDGATMRFRCEGERMVTSHLRAGATEWRPAVTAKLGREDTREVAPAPEAPEVPPEVAEAAARQKEWEHLLANVSFDSLASRVRRLALGVFTEPDVGSNLTTSGGATALRSGISKAFQHINALPSKVFDRLTRMPLAQHIEDNSLVRHQDERAESRRHDPKRTVVPVPAVRLCPGMNHPVSFNEEQMLRLYINDPYGMQYALSSGFRFQVPLDPVAAELSQLITVRRHDALRNAYRLDEYGHPSCKVERDFQGEQLMLCVRDVGDCNAVQSAEYAVANALGISLIRFNVEIATNGWGHQGMNLHHIMGDAEAMGTYWNENAQVQFMLAQGFSPEAVSERLPPLPVQMVDYAYWQRSLVVQGLLEPDLAVWYADIASVHPPLTLDTPIDLPRQRAWKAVGENYFAYLSGELVTLLQDVNARATPFAVVTAAFSLILSRLSGTPSIYMGTPFGLRMLASLQNLIGDFVNMLIFKVRHDSGENFISMLGRAAESAVDVQRYAMAPFLLFVNSVNRFYVTNDPSRQNIYQTMIDVVPKDNEDPNMSMSGILDLFLFANTYRGALWSIECTSNSTILRAQTVRTILGQIPILLRAVTGDTKAEIPRCMPFREEAHVAAEGRRLVLTHLRLKVGPLPHIVGISPGWEYEGEPQECNAIRAARRLKAQSCLELSADLPLAGARAQRPPTFIIRMEQKVQEKMVKEQEDRAQRTQAAKSAPKGIELPDASAPAVAAKPALPAPATKEPKPALPSPEEAEKDLEAEILAEIEARRAQVRRKLAARSVAKGSVKESKMASELIGLDLDQPFEEVRQRQRPRMNGVR